MRRSNVRQPRTPDTHGARRGHRPQPPPSRTLTLLLGLRDRLAILAAEYTAHDLDGAADVVRTLDEVGSAIQGIAPRLHAQRWRTWLEMDVQLAHDATDPSASCSICRALSDPGWWSAQPNRVG